jgi:hypothetical protein
MVLGRGISFEDMADITDTMALQCTNVLGTTLLVRVINLGDTNQHHRHDHPRRTLMQNFI